MASIPVKKNDSVTLRVEAKDTNGPIPIDRVVLKVDMPTPYILDLPASDGVNGIGLLPVPPDQLSVPGTHEATVTIFKDTTLKKTVEFKFKVDDHVGHE